MATIHNESLASLLECPVCFNYASAPIFQCQSGHLICSECRPKIAQCPTCRGPMPGNIRNLAMEKIAEKLRFPCHYTSEGCEAMLKRNEKEEHEKSLCKFRPCYSCPVNGAGSACKWNGTLEEVIPHISTSHIGCKDIPSNKNYVTIIEIFKPGVNSVRYWRMKMERFGKHFLMFIASKDQDECKKWYIWVSLVGSRQESQNYNYRLELGRNSRQLIWKAATLSTCDEVSAATQSSDCLILDNSIVKSFSNNGDLRINFSIAASKNNNY